MTSEIGLFGPDQPLRFPTQTQATTGRWLVIFAQDEDAQRRGMEAMTDAAGLRVAHSTDFSSEAVEPEVLEQAGALFLDELGVAVVNTPPNQIRALGALSAHESGIIAIEPERMMYAIGDGPSADYLAGFQDGVGSLIDRLRRRTGATMPGMEEILAESINENANTWGLQLTNVVASKFTGAGVKVAVLDTGLDLEHPDFNGRSITSKSFINNESVQDGHGHGTHCVGTACGPTMPGALPRYGVASDAQIFVGKVLSNAGSGSDGGILTGINWAIANGCSVVSMSLGAATSVGEAFSPVYENVGRRALQRGTLIIAAAGNESQRPGRIAPVGRPANCPSILSVGAVDRNLAIASFSCGGLNPQGGQVDIAGPGVAVRSSWPRPTLYRSISGTSMATPHVAGIAALHVEANKGALLGGTLGWVLLQSAMRVTLPARDVGAGLVQAP